MDKQKYEKDNLDTNKLYSLKDISNILEISPSLLSYWEKKLAIKTNYKSFKGKKLVYRYRYKDIEKFKLIKKLLKEDKYSLKGVKRILSYQNQIYNKKEILNVLKDTKEFLKSLLD